MAKQLAKRTTEGKPGGPSRRARAPERKTKPGRRPLTRERVLRASVKRADKGGLDAISMRKLAQELGVEAMSLYNHVADKDDALDGMVELVAEEIDLYRDTEDWKKGMRSRMLSAHTMFSKHPWAATLWMTSRSFGPGRLRLADSILGGLRQAGFSDELIYHAYHVLQSHLLGYTLSESNIGTDPAQLKSDAKRFLEEVSLDGFPDIVEHIRQHMQPTVGRMDTFEFGLDLILDSLERKLH